MAFSLCIRVVNNGQLAVSLKSVGTTGWPKPYGPSACTVTGPAVAGKVRVTLATPELLVTAITLVPVKAFSDPTSTLLREPPVALVIVKSTLAPVAVPPDEPGLKVTLRFTGSVVP